MKNKKHNKLHKYNRTLCSIALTSALAAVAVGGLPIVAHATDSTDMTRAMGRTLYLREASAVGTVGENSFTDLKRALEAASSGDTIVLQSNFLHREQGTEGLQINKDITIDGQNSYTLTVRASRDKGIDMHGDLTLKDLTLNISEEGGRAGVIDVGGHHLRVDNVSTKIHDTVENPRPKIKADSGDNTRITIVGGTDENRFDSITLGSNAANIEITSDYAPIDNEITLGSSTDVSLYLSKAKKVKVTGNEGGLKNLIIDDTKVVFQRNINIGILELKNGAKLDVQSQILDPDAGISKDFAISVKTLKTDGSVAKKNTVSIFGDSRISIDTIEGNTDNLAVTGSVGNLTLAENPAYTYNNGTFTPKNKEDTSSSAEPEKQNQDQPESSPPASEPNSPLLSQPTDGDKEKTDEPAVTPIPPTGDSNMPSEGIDAEDGKDKVDAEVDKETNQGGDAPSAGSGNANTGSSDEHSSSVTPPPAPPAKPETVPNAPATPPEEPPAPPASQPQNPPSPAQPEGSGSQDSNTNKEEGSETTHDGNETHAPGSQGENGGSGDDKQGENSGTTDTSSGDTASGSNGPDNSNTGTGNGSADTGAQNGSNQDTPAADAPDADNQADEPVAEPKDEVTDNSEGKPVVPKKENEPAPESDKEGANKEEANNDSSSSTEGSSSQPADLPKPAEKSIKDRIMDTLKGLFTENNLDEKQQQSAVEKTAESLNDLAATYTDYDFSFSLDAARVAENRLNDLAALNGLESAANDNYAFLAQSAKALKTHNSVWVSSSLAEQRGDRDSKRRLSTINLGYDRQFDNLIVGGFVSYLRQKGERGELSSKLHGYSLSLYGKYSQNAHEVVALLNVGRTKADLQRNISALSVSNNAETKGKFVGVRAEYGYRMVFEQHGLQVKPIVALNYNLGRQAAFTESGTMPVHVGKIKAQRLALEAGVELKKYFENAYVYLKPTVQTDLMARSNDVDVRFVDTPNSIPFKSTAKKKTYFALSLGTQVQLRKDLLLDLNANSRIGNHERDIQGSMKLSYKF